MSLADISTSITKIVISSPADYFAQTVQVENDQWTLTFRWLSRLSYFVVTASINDTLVIQQKRVAGGIFILPNWTYGYNFFFYDTRDIAQVSEIENYGLYLISEAQAKEASLKL